jgi:predicted DNA-binding transcriptional regulator AlpA
MVLIDVSLLSKKMEEFENRISQLEGQKTEQIVPLNRFLEMGFMSAPTFYLKAPKGRIPGAFKIGKKWFVDLDVFLSSTEIQK